MAHVKNWEIHVTAMSYYTIHKASNILSVKGKKDAFVFMADRCKPENPSEGTYLATKNDH